MLNPAFLLLLTVAPALAAPTKINGVTYTDNGSSVVSVNGKDALPPEQALRLKKIFLFPSTDDLSGALAPKLDEKLAELFSRNTRFELIRDAQVIKALSPDERSYYKAAQNQSVHREAAKATGADTTVLLRTHNVGANTQMNLELRDAAGNVLFSEEGSIPGSSTMDMRTGLIEKLYKSILAKLPFEGTVTGRTVNTITVDLGLGSLRQGDEIEIARIVSLQRHPLLGTVVGTDYVRTGRAKVGTVDRVLSFAEVQEEGVGEKIAPGQKILRARLATVHEGEVSEDHGPAGLSEKREKNRRPIKGGGAEVKNEADPLDEHLKGDFDQFKPRYGQLGANLYYGSIGHSQSVAGVLSEYAGAGIGGDLNGELWVTKNWILSAIYGFHNATLTGQTASAGDASWNEIAIAAGFRIFPDSVTEGVVLTGSLGYQSMSFAIPESAALGLSGKKYSGVILRADGEINFLQKQKISVGIGIQPFASLKELGTPLGEPNKGIVIGAHLGWNRQLTDEMWLRIGARYDVANASYADSSTTVSNKRFAIGPGINYLF